MKNSINIAVIGLGGRGHGMIKTMCLMDDINIIGVCDVYVDRVEKAQNTVKEKKGNVPFGTTDYREILKLEKLDSVYISTDWSTHIKISIDVMKAGIRPATEVGGAETLDECWELVNTYEETHVPVMMMENCCYGEREMMVHNMVRDGAFGKIVACSGKYAHDLRSEIGHGTKNRHYRLRNYLNRNCENYPTHELGPIAKLLEINRGNRFTSLVSVCSGSEGMLAFAEKRSEKDFKKELNGRKFAQADIVKTVIMTEKGEFIDLTLDTTLPRFYSRGYTVRGTKGLFQEDGDIVYLDKKSYHDKEFDQKNFWGRAKRFEKKYNSPLWSNTSEEMLRAGHGGMDWHVIRAWVESVKNNTFPPIDVYDAASWMAVTALSDISLKNGSSTVDFPDFTRGKYMSREDIPEGPYAIV